MCEQYDVDYTTLRIEADTKTRFSRGFKYNQNIDQDQYETDLDHYQHNLVYYNKNSHQAKRNIQRLLYKLLLF